MELRGISHHYGRHDALTLVDLHASSGEVVAILGPNGSGKTTLLQAASGALRPSTGTVYLDGADMARRSPADAARLRAAVEQEVRPGFDFSVREVVEFGRIAHSGRLQQLSARDRAAADRAMAFTHTTTLADRRVRTLSSGERQRVWLSMALAQEPRVLVLDEPTAYLDPRYQVEIMRIVAKMSRRGMAVMLATHDIGLASAFATRLVLLDGGVIVAAGAAREVLSDALVEQVYGTEVRLIRDASGLPVAVAPRVAEAL